VAISVDFARETLRELLSIHDRMITVDMIKKKVVEFYHLRESDMVSKKRSRSIARPRQVAMSLSKELTDLSLPDIGQAFGGRDHTTVLHACRKVEELMRSDPQLAEDRRLLMRSLTGH
jgi:chromosomal replication initiator protein